MESLQENTASHPEPTDLETTTKSEVFGEEPSTEQGPPEYVQFEFVERGSDARADSQARSHAMKMYWRQKKGSRGRREQNESENHRAMRPLLPAKSLRVQPRDIPREEDSQKIAPSESETFAHSRTDTSLIGLSGQLWAGLQFPFSRALDWANNDFPCQVTAEHRKLFYHWIAMHTEEIHSRLETQTFSPFRDIWMPLDLSNVASFNGIMAHAAADLSQTRHKEICSEAHSEALGYKTDTIELINKWLGDPMTAFKDDVFAAVLRLFTFERHWGTSERSILHRDGLRQMVQAKGGYKTFETNWRLQLALSLIYLMPEPVSMDFPVEEMEDFFCDALGLSYPAQAMRNRFVRYEDSSSLTTLKKAIEFLRLQRLEIEPFEEYATSENDPALFTLPSILFICVALVEGRHEAYQDHSATERIDLRSLDTLLLDSHSIWFNSEKSLSDLVWNQFARRERNLQRRNEIKTIIRSLSGMSPPALRGLELCLLEALMI